MLLSCYSHCSGLQRSIMCQEKLLKYFRQVCARTVVWEHEPFFFTPFKLYNCFSKTKESNSNPNLGSLVDLIIRLSDTLGLKCK